LYDYEDDFMEMVEAFEDEFDVTARSTGNYYAEDMRIVEEYFIEGLIESPARGLSFSVAGQFIYYVPDGRGTCHFTIKMNGEDLLGLQQLMAWYEDDRWSELTLESM